jgi:hypothetical protein
VNDTKDKLSIFNDPEGKFSMMIPSSWKYYVENTTNNKNLHQFEVGPEIVFQISVNPIDDHISEIITGNNIIPHDTNLPSISFIEKFKIHASMEMYSWMAVVNNQFVLALCYFNSQKVDHKELGMLLYEVRLTLRTVALHRQEGEEAKRPGFIPKDISLDYSDIENWRDNPQKYFANLGAQERLKTFRISPLKIDTVKLYALLTLKVSHQPNGFFDLLKVRKPLDNTIWWDFILECAKGYIHIWRTPFILETQYHFDGELDVESFFDTNFDKYKKEIAEKIKTFDRHIIYINHYKSYNGCVETLWKEIQEINLAVPEAPTSHLTLDGEMEKYTKLVEIFSASSIKYHALAKSLLLNAAFKIESYLNLLIRIGATPELRQYPEVLSRFLKMEFAQRVKNFRFYSQILTADIDMGSDIYRKAKELMTLRNKYVHYDEDATHNKLGEILYDRDYPLHQVEENRPAIDAIIKTYHNPNIHTVHQAYEISNQFVTMVENLFIPEMKNGLQFLVDQNPIGFNETKAVYSAVYTPIALDFFAGIEKPVTDP